MSKKRAVRDQNGAQAYWLPFRQYYTDAFREAWDRIGPGNVANDCDASGNDKHLFSHTGAADWRTLFASLDLKSLQERVRQVAKPRSDHAHSLSELSRFRVKYPHLLIA